jgi:hypothetical protein
MVSFFPPANAPQGTANTNTIAIVKTGLRMVVSDLWPLAYKIAQRRRADYDFRNSSGSLAMFAAIRRASSLVSSLAADRRPWLILEYTEVWPGVCLSIALVSSECLRCVLSGRDYDEAKSNKDCQFLFIFLAVGLCAGPCTGAATGADRTTVTPVYVCA